MTLYPETGALAVDDPFSEFGSARSTGTFQTPYLLPRPLSVSTSDRALCTPRRRAVLLQSPIYSAFRNKKAS
jgi:hypothetical protein